MAVPTTHGSRVRRNCRPGHGSRATSRLWATWRLLLHRDTVQTKAIARLVERIGGDAKCKVAWPVCSMRRMLPHPSQGRLGPEDQLSVGDFAKSALLASLPVVSWHEVTRRPRAGPARRQRLWPSILPSWRQLQSRSHADADRIWHSRNANSVANSQSLRVRQCRPALPTLPF